MSTFIATLMNSHHTGLMATNIIDANGQRVRDHINMRPVDFIKSATINVTSKLVIIHADLTQYVDANGNVKTGFTNIQSIKSTK